MLSVIERIGDAIITTFRRLTMRIRDQDEFESQPLQFVEGSQVRIDCGDDVDHLINPFMRPADLTGVGAGPLIHHI